MREAFHAELNMLRCDLVNITRLSGQTMTTASTALHHADLGLAEQADAEVDALRRRIFRSCSLKTGRMEWNRR
jgi:hypothetical protein